MTRRGRPPKNAYLIFDPDEIERKTGNPVIRTRWSKAKGKQMPTNIKPICSKCLNKVKKSYTIKKRRNKDGTTSTIQIHCGYYCETCDKNFNRPKEVVRR